MSQSSRVKHAFITTFGWFIMLDVCIMTCELITLLINNRSYVGIMELPTPIIMELLMTCLEQLLLSIGLAYGQALLSNKHPRAWVAWLTLCSILLTNTYFFPLSLFSRTLYSLIPSPYLCSLMLVSWLMLSAMMIHALGYRWIMLGLSIPAVMLSYTQINANAHPTPLPSETPNVIIIGIDSLNANAITPTLTPSIFAWIKQSVSFDDTISPLARTSPAWMTILTGLYPQHHGVIYNLMPVTQTMSQRSIVWSLQTKGYATVFATDDRRFNTVDKELGFDTVIGPKRGVNDALIGSLNDFPLSNLIINLPISQFLFPYNHSNRASHYTYYPSTFDRTIQHALRQQKSQKPLFLAVHFTLPHWPYAFASSDPRRVNDEFRVENREPLYAEALHAVDHQVGTLLQFLKQQQRLNNSIVVMLSDHGETLYTPQSRQTTQQNYQGALPSRFEHYLLKNTATVLDKSAGHGSDLLSQAQYHCLLGWKIYKHKLRITVPHHISQRVGLIDIAPTLADLLTLNHVHPMDGQSLVPLFTQTNHTATTTRTFILESGMLPNQSVSKTAARRLAKQFFSINPENGFLEIRHEQIAILNRMKLFGILEDDWLLALYPTADGYLPIVQQLSTGAWIDSLDHPFAQASPGRHLLHQLSLFYHHTWPLSRR